ncbi:thiol-disulfide oxidoreductase DCC family protein [Jeotgalibacillus marinus]|uniref:DCC1-like thiol-disulfide oxidoreductase family protein n=1 Tax=Jeotgalibacillus marinus TaxID=86667 RepID=A0ABV3Q6N9_9BACL
MKRDKLIVYYDSDCPLCTKVKNKWSKIDIFNNLEFYSFRNLNVSESLPIEQNKLEKEIYSQIKGKQVYFHGLDTLIEMNKRIPMICITVPFLWFSKKLGVGQKIYQYVADNRKILPSNQCNENQCDID